MYPPMITWPAAKALPTRIKLSSIAEIMLDFLIGLFPLLSMEWARKGYISSPTHHGYLRRTALLATDTQRTNSDNKTYIR